MGLIDDNGRFLGVINAIDALAMVLVLTVVSASDFGLADLNECVGPGGGSSPQIASSILSLSIRSGMSNPAASRSVGASRRGSILVEDASPVESRSREDDL